MPLGSADLWMAPIIPIVDFNGDGRTNGNDTAVLEACWGSGDLRCDVGPYAWGDGVVDIQDWMALAEYIDEMRSPGRDAVGIDPDVVLRWQPSPITETSDVYFGTSFDDVSNADRGDPRGVLVSQGQTASTYDPEGLLEFGQRYFWRIDEVTSPPESIVHQGIVWSFTIEEFVYPVQSITATAATAERGSPIENTINGSGLSGEGQHSTDAADMWLADVSDEPAWIQYEFDRVYKLHEMVVWNCNVQFELVMGMGLKDVTIEYSENGTGWTSLGDFEFAQATAKPSYACNTTVDFGGVVQGRTSARRRRGEEVARPFVRLEQGLDPGPQLVIAPAGLVQIGRSLGRVLDFKGPVEDFLPVFLRCRHDSNLPNLPNTYVPDWFVVTP